MTDKKDLVTTSFPKCIIEICLKINLSQTWIIIINRSFNRKNCMLSWSITIHRSNYIGRWLYIQILTVPVKVKSSYFWAPLHQLTLLFPGWALCLLDRGGGANLCAMRHRKLHAKLRRWTVQPGIKYVNLLVVQCGKCGKLTLLAVQNS